MENNLVNFKIDLGINAQKIVSQIQLNNRNIEEQISQGIELAIIEIANKPNFVESIKLATEKELLDIVNNRILSFDIRQKIIKMIDAKVGEKLDIYAEKIANKITESLNI